MRQFVSHGYLVLKTDFSKDFHDAMSRNIQEVMKKEGQPWQQYPAACARSARSFGIR